MSDEATMTRIPPVRRGGDPWRASIDPSRAWILGMVVGDDIHASRAGDPVASPSVRSAGMPDAISTYEGGECQCPGDCLIDHENA